MATLLTHPAVPLAIALAVGVRSGAEPTAGASALSRRLLLAGVVASMLPDLDVLAFRFGVAYADAQGHRGMSHSLLFALLLGLVGYVSAPWLQSRRRTAAGFLFLATASHPLLDALTNGGLGVALAWPFSDARFFAPFQPIEVSPLGLKRLFSPQMLTVLGSEIRWVWLPLLGLALPLRWVLRRRVAPGPAAHRS